MKKPRPDAPEQRWRVAMANFEDAERSGASDDVLLLLEEAVIAARISMLRRADHLGRVISAADHDQLKRDRELLRRFPRDRGGAGGIGWFDWPAASSL
jgi:hypothetical protein